MRRRLALASAVLAATSPTSAGAVGSGALWVVVRACTLDSQVLGSPWPCLQVDRRRGFTVVPDPKRRTQLLVTPTRRISGIESLALQTPNRPNYWLAAWEARGWLDRRAGRPVPPEDVGFAVNSRPGRTQDELHIHIDGLRSSVRQAVDADLDEVDEDWAELPTPLVRGHRYRARWLGQEALATTDPFRLLAADPETGGDLTNWTLVMLAAHRPTGERGFVLLSHRADPAAQDLAAGEELLDHARLLPPPAAPGRPRPKLVPAPRPAISR